MIDVGARHTKNGAADDKVQRIGGWRWGTTGAALCAIGSALIVRDSWHSAEAVAENVTFVCVSAFVGAVLGLLAGQFAAPKPRDPRTPRWWW